MPRVLIVDDETSIQTLVAYNFQRSGFDTEVVGDGLTALARVKSAPSAFDLVILDVMLPGMDGVEVCKRLRQDRIRVPIILLTARDEEVDLILGLEMGADDYVTKPFSPRELVARAKAVLRRVEQHDEERVQDSDAEAPRTLVAGDITMDLNRHEVTVRGRIVDLTPKEFDLLRYLMANRDYVLSREQLLDKVWGYAAATDTRIVDVHMSHLREKIEVDAKAPAYLRTVRGVGYKFVVPQ
ncbi:MAG: response regulator transcription factor [Alicyclobacillus sp.]|nr:response regulator transcription factor [Alicyclobacillus sp.]